MGGTAQAIWNDGDGNTTYWHARYGSESVPAFVSRGPRHARDAFDGPGDSLEEVFIEGWFAVDEPRKVLLLGYDVWSLARPELNDDPVLRRVSDNDDPEGRRWLLAWLRAAWPRWSIAIARDPHTSLPEVLRGRPLTTVPVHRDPPDPPATGGAADATIHRMADGFAADYYSYGDGSFHADSIRPLKQIVERLSTAAWEPRPPG
jgi:hypothetical protein